MHAGCKSILFCFFIIIASQLCAQVKLPALIRDSMILQRDAKITIWGWASGGEKVSLAFNKKKYSAKAAADGNWRIVLPATKAGGPYTMELAGKNRIVLNNILFGDVWFCSGQSNMVHQMNIHDVRYAKEIAAANYPEIRQYWVPTITNLQSPQKDLPAGNWRPAVGDGVRPFSAVAYFFAKKLYEENHIPIGIINAAVGGTPIEAWISEDGFKDFSAQMDIIKKNKDTAYTNGFNRRNMTAVAVQQTDAGMIGEKKWFDVNYIPAGWRNINIPGYWEDQGIKDLNGVVWYRREINIPAALTGRQAKVFFGKDC